MRDKNGSINGVEWRVWSLGHNVHITVANEEYEVRCAATTAAEAHRLAELGDALHEGAHFLEPGITTRGQLEDLLRRVRDCLDDGALLIPNGGAARDRGLGLLAVLWEAGFGPNRQHSGSTVPRREE